jgi:uncharacterized protein YqeY
MLDRDAHTTATLRILKSEIKNAEIADGDSFSEETVLQVIRREVKKRYEAMETFKAIGSTERFAQEEGEAAFLKKYLPAAADPAQVEEFVHSLVGTTQNKGELIKRTIEHFKGTADGKTVAELVNRLA